MGIANVISLLGGLALFLYGMSVMGASLKKVAGSKLESVLEKLTKNRLLGVLLGAVVTAIIQSSSATSVMVIGFVNSGMMKLAQAIGVIMGANIGTTATAWILSLSSVQSSSTAALLSVGTISAIIALVGIAFYMFSKKQRNVHIGGIMLGFAVLMFGMTQMSSAVAPLKESEAFIGMLSVFSNPALGIIVGILFTAVIQSSSASVGVLQALSVSVAIKYSAVIPLVLGMNIGACVPVLIAGLSSTTKNGKRAGLVYLYYNVLGTIAFLIVYYAVGIFYDYSSITEAVSTSVGIAIFNTVYKLFITVVLLPFTKGIEKLVCASVPDRKGDNDEAIELLDEHFLNYPPLAVERCNATIQRMATLAHDNLLYAIGLTEAWESDGSKKVESVEESIDLFEDKLGTYLVKLSTKEMLPKEQSDITKCLHCISDIERIGDHAVNVMEAAEEIYDKKIVFSSDAQTELTALSGAVKEILSLSFKAFAENDAETAHKVEPLEQVIDYMCDELKARHIERLRKGECTIEIGFVFNDLLGNYERIADHCSNIAACILQLAQKDSTLDTHEYMRAFKEDSEFMHDFESYKERFLKGVR